MGRCRGNVWIDDPHPDGHPGIVQALVILCVDHCSSLLTGLLACAICPLQLIQNTAGQLVFNLPTFYHTTAFLCTLQWFLLDARIPIKSLLLAYSAGNGFGQSCIQDMVRPDSPARATLRSMTHMACSSLNSSGDPSCRSTTSRQFEVLAPRWWNELPADIRGYWMRERHTHKVIHGMYFYLTYNKR